MGCVRGGRVCLGGAVVAVTLQEHISAGARIVESQWLGADGSPASEPENWRYHRLVLSNGAEYELTLAEHEALRVAGFQPYHFSQDVAKLIEAQS